MKDYRIGYTELQEEKDQEDLYFRVFRMLVLFIVAVVYSTAFFLGE